MPTREGAHDRPRDHAGDHGHNRREGQDYRDPAAGGSGLAGREHQRGDHVAPDERRQQQEPDDRTRAVCDRQWSNRFGREGLVELLGCLGERSIDVDVAEEALRLGRHERVGVGTDHVAAVDVPGLGRRDEVALVGVGLEVQAELLLHRIDDGG